MAWKFSLSSLPARQRHSAKLVLIKLCDNASDEGYCFPSMSTVARECELTRRSVIHQIEKLKSIGLVSVKHRYNKNNQSSNGYYINIELLSMGELSSLPSELSSPEWCTQFTQNHHRTINESSNNNVDSHQRTCERAFIDELQDKPNCTVAMQVLKELSAHYQNIYTGSQTQEQWNACEDALIELWDGFCGDYGSLYELMTDVAVGMLEKRFSKRKSVGLPAMLMVNSGDDLVTVLEKSDILEL